VALAVDFKIDEGETAKRRTKLAAEWGIRKALRGEWSAG
jgi:hypothetical protein